MNILDQVRILAEQSYVYMPEEKEPVNIFYVCSVDADEDQEEVDYFEGTGAETSMEYRISFTDVNLSTDKFFKLVEVKP